MFHERMFQVIRDIIDNTKSMVLHARYAEQIPKEILAARKTAQQEMAFLTKDKFSSIPLSDGAGMWQLRPLPDPGDKNSPLRILVLYEVGVELQCAIMEKRPSRESVSGFTWKEMDHRLTEEQILRWFDIKTAFAWVPIAGPRDIIALLTCEMTP